jgi:hypothetical protein
MYTVEYEHDAIILTTLDETDSFEDVEVIMGDDMTVYMRQWSDATNQYEMLYMSYQQLVDLFSAMSSTEGMYVARIERG